jgi:hypothetical protein
MEDAGERGVEWKIVPVGAQHYNGQAERMIGLLKQVLEQALKNQRCSFGELQCVLKEAAYVVNSRPLGKNTDDPDDGGPITANHLLMGRSGRDVPMMKFLTKPTLTRRLQLVDEIQKDFWNKWMKVVAQEKILTGKWRKTHRDSQVGDVILLKEETMASQHYRMGIISKVLKGEDGRVRTVDVKYRNPGEKVFRTTTRTVHKVVTLVPVDLEPEEDTPLTPDDKKEA